MYRTLRLTFSDRIATLALQRPGQRNAMSTELMREMIACAAKLAVRDDLDVVIVTGSGRCFSAGADLKDSQCWADDSTPLAQRREIAALGACNAYIGRGAAATSFMAHDQLLLAAASPESKAARERFLLSRAGATQERSRAQPGRRGSVRRRRGPAPK